MSMDMDKNSPAVPGAAAVAIRAGRVTFGGNPVLGTACPGFLGEHGRLLIELLVELI